MNGSKERWPILISTMLNAAVDGAPAVNINGTVGDLGPCGVPRTVLVAYDTLPDNNDRDN